MVVMEDVTEEERSAELYVSVHGGLDHTFLKRGVHRDLRCKLSLSQKAFLCRSWRVCWLEDSSSVKLLVPACLC